jgi:hypothetical protein
MACCLGKRVRAADSGHALTRTAPQHHHLRCFKGHLPRAPGRAGVAYPGSSEIGYSPGVRGLLGAGSRSARTLALRPDSRASPGFSRYAVPLRFSVIFEYGGLIP